MSVNEETVSTLPFFSLSDRDFNHFLGNCSVPDLNEAVDFNVSVNSKTAHAPPGQTPGHLTFLKNFGQIPRYVAS